MKKILFVIGMGMAQFAIAADVSELDTRLTPVGAERASNLSGDIPAWSGSVLGAPPGVNYKGTGTHYPNPYPDEKPLFIITADNMQQYADKISDGQRALFEAYPETFQMHVYPSKREARYSDKVHENTRLNAATAKLKDNADGVSGVYHGFAFPLANSAEQVIWNHKTSPLLGFNEAAMDAAAVYVTGERSMRRTLEQREINYYNGRYSRETIDTTPISVMAMMRTLEPAREKGNIILLHEYRDVSEVSRDAWMYMPAMRRVRRAPTFAYDFPDGPGGLRTVDDVLMFNGSMSRFDWEYHGKRELFIPYNNYELDNPEHRYDDILTAKHIRPDVVRYELHRVHEVTAKLKEGKRHIYGKRRFYFDEDSWAGVLSENYDNKGNLWRANMRSMVNMYDLPGMGPRVEVYHDLQKKAYVAAYLINEAKGPPKHVAGGWPNGYFSANNLRQLGK